MSASRRAQARARVDPQLVDEDRPGPAQHGEGVALAAGAVQRERQQPPGVLPPGVRGRVRVQIRRRLRGPAQGEQCLGPPLHGAAAAAPSRPAARRAPTARRRTRRRRARATSASASSSRASTSRRAAASRRRGDGRLEPPGVDRVRARRAARSPGARSPAAAAGGGAAGPAPARGAGRRRTCASPPTAPAGGVRATGRSTRRSTGTTRPRATTSRASTARCRGPFSATGSRRRPRPPPAPALPNRCTRHRHAIVSCSSRADRSLIAPAAPGLVADP